MTTNLVQLSVDDHIATVTLNRPEKRNALSIDLFKAITATIKTISKDATIRAVIVRGNGEDFCSGLDIKGVMSNAKNPLALLFKWWPSKPNLAQRVSQGWRNLPVPVFFAIHGRCWGGGMQIALGGDFRIATADASLSVMESKWGLCPDMAGTLGLREVMPLDQALMISMSAEEVSAQRALQYNLITEISDDPYKRALTLAKELANKSPDALAAIKKIYHKAWHKNDGDILSLETRSQIKILLGKNQRIASKKAIGDERASYLPRKNW